MTGADSFLFAQVSCPDMERRLPGLRKAPNTEGRYLPPMLYPL